MDKYLYMSLSLELIYLNLNIFFARYSFWEEDRISYFQFACVMYKTLGEIIINFQFSLLAWNRGGGGGSYAQIRYGDRIEETIFFDYFSLWIGKII